MNNTKTKQILNQAVADLSQFSVMIHQIHWYIRGKVFFTWHPKMDEFMDEINDQLDLVAERLIITGGAPFSTLKEFAEHTKLKEKKGDFGMGFEQHAACLLEGYRYFASLYSKGIETAGKEGDDVTQDLFTSLKAVVDKKVWMLEATLQK